MQNKVKSPRTKFHQNLLVSYLMAANLLRFFGFLNWIFLELIQNKGNMSHTFAKVMGLKLSTNKVTAATYKVSAYFIVQRLSNSQGHIKAVK